ncbi:MAG: divalent-cation tolerance protein CutA [Chloroflexota bacterium]|nr:MAG: divalent-cation tolerance protein CutA [Chloroflexota bacterium]
MRLLISTCPPTDADRIADALLSKRLVACVSIVPGVRSKYWWQGELVTDDEVVLLIKTQDHLIDQVLAELKAVHPYQVPELLSLPVEKGNPDYLAWVADETRVRG